MIEYFVFTLILSHFGRPPFCHLEGVLYFVSLLHKCKLVHVFCYEPLYENTNDILVVLTSSKDSNDVGNLSGIINLRLCAKLVTDSYEL